MKRPAWSSDRGSWPKPVVWLIVVALVAAGVVGGIVETRRTSSTTHCVSGYVAHNGFCVKGGPAAASEAVVSTVPSGDQRISFGYASIDVPTGWRTSILACRGSDQTVFLGAFGRNASDCTPQGPRPGVYAALDELTGAPAAGTSVVVNGHPGTRHQAAGAQIYDFADLHVELTVSGPQSGPIAASIDWSPLYGVLNDTGHVVLQGTTRVYRFQGLQVTVPASWPAWRVGVGAEAEPGCGNDFVHGPDVLLGQPFTVNCGLQWQAPAPIDGVWLTGRIQGANELSGTVIATNHGTQIYSDMVNQDPTGTAQTEILVEVRNGAGQVLTATVGLGPNPAVAEAIIQSLQPTTKADSHAPKLPL